MTNFDTIKTKATQTWNKASTATKSGAWLLLASIIAVGVLMMSLTIGLMVLGFSTLVLLIALPFGGLKGLQERAVQAAP